MLLLIVPNNDKTRLISNDILTGYTTRDIKMASKRNAQDKISSSMYVASILYQIIGDKSKKGRQE